MLAPVPTLAEPVPALTDRQLQLLGRLAEAGLQIALALERQAKAAAPEAGAADLSVDLESVDLEAVALAYSRVARAVRQTVMLQSRLVEALQAGAEAAEERRTRKAGARARAARIIRRVIEAEHEAPERIERLAAEAAERLDEEVHGDLLERPVEDIIADICADLGLHPDWPSLAEDVAAAEALAKGAPAGGAAGDDGPDDGPDEVMWLSHGAWVPASPRDSS